METNPNRYGNLDQAVAAEVRAELARQKPAKSIAELAETLGLHRSNISTRINGHTPFTVGELVRVAQYLGTTSEALTSLAEQHFNAQEAAA